MNLLFLSLIFLSLYSTSFFCLSIHLHLYVYPSLFTFLSLYPSSPFSLSIPLHLSVPPSLSTFLSLYPYSPPVPYPSLSVPTSLSLSTFLSHSLQSASFNRGSIILNITNSNFKCPLKTDTWLNTWPLVTFLDAMHVTWIYFVQNKNSTKLDLMLYIYTHMCACNSSLHMKHPVPMGNEANESLRLLNFLCRGWWNGRMVSGAHFVRDAIVAMIKSAKC